MAATIIIYAGAIIVTFLFVLMLSQATGPSDENDRTREPLYGSFAGFAFVGLVLFTLYQSSLATAAAEPGQLPAVGRLPAPVVTPEERKILADVIAKLDGAAGLLDGDVSDAPPRTEQLKNAERLKNFDKAFEPIKNDLAAVVGVSSRAEGGEQAIVGSIRDRLEQTAAKGSAPAVLFRDDSQARAALKRAATIREATHTTPRRVDDIYAQNRDRPDVEAAKTEVRNLRNEIALLSGMGELPANNVRNLGLVLYSEHLLAVELAGTLLLVAVIGAIAVAHRKGVAK